MSEAAAIEVATRGDRFIVKRAENGDVWGGTVCWLVKERTPDLTDKPIDPILAGPFDAPLVGVMVDHLPVLCRGMDDETLLRIYQRPDARYVYLSDAFLTTIEELCEKEDDEGDLWPVDLVLRQDEAKVLGPVGVFDGDELVAVVMPVRRFNSGLTP